jgi:outer membrane lipoprotein-sorting protein
VIAGCVLASACQPGNVRPQLPATVPPADRLLAVLTEQRAAVRSIRGFAQIAYESGEDNIGARHAVLVRRPDHFRLEVLSPLGALAVIATDAEQLVVYDRRAAKIYRGPASAGSVAVYTQVPVEVADVTSILLGTPPERIAIGPLTVTRDEEANAFKLTMPVALGRQLVWFDPQTLMPVASETPLPDGVRLRVAFGEYRELGTLRFPHAIDMRAEPGDRVVRVRYGTPSLNTDIAETLFVFPPREGLRELSIDQYSAGGGG